MSSLFQWLKVAVTFVRTNERRRRRRFTKRENEEGKIRHLRGETQQTKWKSNRATKNDEDNKSCASHFGPGRNQEKMGTKNEIHSDLPK